MSDDTERFKVTMISPVGEAIYTESWSLIKGGDAYQGMIRDDDRLVQALRVADQVDAGTELTAEQQDLFRSFLWQVTHLTSPDEKLFQVFDLGMPLSRSADYIWRIGMFDRAAGAVAGVAIVATNVGLCVASFNGGLLVGGAAIGGVAGDIAASFLSDVGSTLGVPGEAVYRSNFEAASLLHLLRLLRIRHLLPMARFDSAPSVRVAGILDAQIMRLMVVNSRQISGLALAGAAEASSAVVAHSLIALTFSALPDREEVLDNLDLGARGLSEDYREEVLGTLNGIKETISMQDVVAIERQLNRHLLSSSTAEAMDVAAQPVRLAFDLFGSIASGLGTVVGGGSATGEGNLFHLVGEQLKTVSTAVDLTPDMAAKALNAQFAVESWTRKQVGDLWGMVWKNRDNV